MSHEKSINNNNSQNKLEPRLCVLLFSPPNFKWGHIKMCVSRFNSVCGCQSDDAAGFILRITAQKSLKDDSRHPQILRS